MPYKKVTQKIEKKSKNICAIRKLSLPLHRIYKH